jgi:short-subunit dehydrogenase
MAASAHTSGRLAVVTGASGGLGTAFVNALRSRGYRVVGTDLAGSDRVLDVSDADACRHLAREVRPDVWINNAGVVSAGSAIEQPDAEIRRTVEVNLLGVINGTRAAVEVMRERGSGTVLNIASLASFAPLPGETVYAATKHAVRAFTVGTAYELRGSGIRLTTLCPDGIRTPMLDSIIGDRRLALVFSGGRAPLEPDRVAKVGVELIDGRRYRPLASIPRHRGVLARLVGISPRLFLIIAPLLETVGQRNQARLLRRRTTEIGAKS